MDFNDYLGPLVNVESATSISPISLVDLDVGSFSSYIYQPTPWAKHTKTTIRGAPSLGNPSCSKLDFSPPLIVTVVATLPSPVILAASRPSVSVPRNTLVPSIFYDSPASLSSHRFFLSNCQSYATYSHAPAHQYMPTMFYIAYTSKLAILPVASYVSFPM